MGRKKKTQLNVQNNDCKIEQICYICNKKIGNKLFYAIGKDKNGKELYRHRKCSTLNYKRNNK